MSAILSQLLSAAEGALNPNDRSTTTTSSLSATVLGANTAATIQATAVSASALAITTSSTPRATQIITGIPFTQPSPVAVTSPTVIPLSAAPEPVSTSPDGGADAGADNGGGDAPGDLPLNTTASAVPGLATSTAAVPEAVSTSAATRTAAAAANPTPEAATNQVQPNNNNNGNKMSIAIVIVAITVGAAVLFAAVFLGYKRFSTSRRRQRAAAKKDTAPSEKTSGFTASEKVNDEEKAQSKDDQSQRSFSFLLHEPKNRPSSEILPRRPSIRREKPPRPSTEIVIGFSRPNEQEISNPFSDQVKTNSLTLSSTSPTMSRKAKEHNRGSSSEHLDAKFEEIDRELIGASTYLTRDRNPSTISVDIGLSQKSPLSAVPRQFQRQMSEQMMSSIPGPFDAHIKEVEDELERFSEHSRSSSTSSTASITVVSTVSQLPPPRPPLELEAQQQQLRPPASPQWPVNPFEDPRTPPSPQWPTYETAASRPPPSPQWPAADELENSGWNKVDTEQTSPISPSPPSITSPTTQSSTSKYSLIPPSEASMTTRTSQLSIWPGPNQQRMAGSKPTRGRRRSSLNQVVNASEGGL